MAAQPKSPRDKRKSSDSDSMTLTAADLVQRMMHGERYRAWKDEHKFDLTDYYINDDEHVEAFVLPSTEWSEHHHPLISMSNHRTFLRWYPNWVKDDVAGRTHQAVVPANLLYLIPAKDYRELTNSAAKVRDDYPLVDDDDHSSLEMEYQNKSWEETERERFKEFLVEHIEVEYEGDIDKLGEPVAEKMVELLTNDKLDNIFWELERNGGGDHWDDHYGTGEYSLDINRLLSSNYLPNVPHSERYQETLDGIYQELLGELYPEDPRQMKFPFADEVAEALLENAVEMSDDPSPAAKMLVATLLEGHSYSCVMINLPDELADRINSWGKQQIPDTALFVDKDGGMGREEETHVTVKFGLLDAMPSPELKDVFRNTQPFDIELKPITLFRQDDYDVVKMDVISAQLHALNREVCNVAPHHDTHPEYHPHVTIAYVKKGTCDRLEGVSPFDDPVKLGVSSLGTDGKFTAKSVVFSSSTDVKRDFALGGGIVKEAMTPQDLIRKAGLTPEKQKFSGIRRRVGRELVDAVWIDKVDKPREGYDWGVEGELRIFFHGKRTVITSFCSFDVLKMSVRQWRNIYGAKLFVNGKEAGVVSYMNPALQDKASAFGTKGVTH